MFRFFVIPLLLLACLPPSALAQPFESPLALREIYARQVTQRLDIPADEQLRYAELLGARLLQAGVTPAAQYVLLVDRSPQVQASLLFWIAHDGHYEFIGASPVSTGKQNGFEYFETPLGVFDHSALLSDFRAEGTRNGYGIMGYGLKGMRVYDFGWVQARRTWDNRYSPMRLQLHATDPNHLEPRLGTAQSKGCIRIPATLNRLLDHYGILDAGYEQAQARGRRLWVLPTDRESTPWSGRYLVVVDTERNERPAWSPLPAGQAGI